MRLPCRQGSFQCGAGPADQVQKPALRCAPHVLVTVPLLAEALQGMVLWRRQVQGFEPQGADGRQGTQQVGVRQVGLGVLAEILAQSLDALSLDADHLGAGSLEPACHREPGHAGRFHDGLDRCARRHLVRDLVDQLIEVRRVKPESKGLADRAAVVVDLGHLLRTDGQVDANGSSLHVSSPPFVDGAMLGSSARYLIRGRGMRHYLVTLACASSASRLSVTASGRVEALPRS